MAIRKDLNGKLITHPNGDQAWFIVEGGKRKGLQSGFDRDRILISDYELVLEAGVNQIDEAAPWTAGVRLIRNPAGTVCVQDGNSKRYVSAIAMGQYQFDHAKVVVLSETAFNAIPTGAPIEERLTVFPLLLPQVKDKSGSTTAYASGKVSKQPGGGGLIEVAVRVKKTGINGKGFAGGQVILFDKDRNTIFKTDVVQKHKGAGATDGLSEGNAGGDFQVPANILQATDWAGVVVHAVNNEGLPESLAEYTKKVKEITDAFKATGELIAAIMVVVAIVA